MPAAVVGGNLRYPTLQAIANLFRAQINDDFAGATNTPGEGVIAFNTAPFLLTIMDSAIRELYSDLRNVGDPSLILDNYILTGLPALTGPNPTVQTSLSYAGFFDGFQWHPQWTLPISCTKVERMWERWTGSQESFTPMSLAPFGLPPCMQVSLMGQWEYRQNAVWMPGSLVQEDLRIRCRITFPDFLDPVSINFNDCVCSDCRFAECNRGEDAHSLCQAIRTGTVSARGARRDAIDGQTEVRSCAQHAIDRVPESHVWRRSHGLILVDVD